MKAYKCDVCGKYYSTPTGYEDKTDPVTGAGIGFLPTGIQFTGEEGTKIAPNHDICQDCMYYFRKIIKEIKAKGGADSL